MGTRNLICVYYHGKFLVAQCAQWDGDAGGQSAIIVEFLIIPGNVERLKAGLQHIEILDNYSGQAWEEAAELSPVFLHHGDLPRNTGTHVLELVAGATVSEPALLVMDLDLILAALRLAVLRK